ncbi:MAG: hypothetical protein ACP5SH_22540 [Syntrophobacteraceae bacterium]
MGKMQNFHLTSSDKDALTLFFIAFWGLVAVVKIALAAEHAIHWWSAVFLRIAFFAVGYWTILSLTHFAEKMDYR